MKKPSASRRNFVKTAGLGFLTLPNLLQTGPASIATKKKAVCFGGHPDDPESGCGGTLAKLAAMGHDVTIIYLTTGEAGIEGKSHSEAATIRKQEAINACAILKAKPVFAGQIDGDTIMDNTWLAKVQKMIADERPDIVFTHWPIDTHKDHQIASLLMIQTWVRSEHKYPLYFFEVCTGEQTMGFKPTDYVDITETQEQKRKSVYCHVSQDPPGIYGCGHASMEDFRGRELGVKAAEAFVFMTGKGMGGVIAS
ncbi:PIG-L deacetylase family protein [Mucilaginibacter ginsenosidivorans]|uniref:PIG-L family deacetylase n=1 Tax=Mucilaginibacter ginsenosidivorans TaxID=398053 RepID=A0A5B8UU01_9SPHI|nr:PIG-L deacetylase family protein [Mucilaginibacter ginsenosidivorans]QEC62235.1 PIG-L family deacetylase [Mucilaginibacter ginsenosidivorans]